MNKEQRRNNLRKLRLPKSQNQNSKRDTQDSNDVTAKISTYFESHNAAPQQQTTLPKESDYFVTPLKQIKKAPARRKVTAKNGSTKSKKQPIIKSALFRNEQVFAEAAMQHCIADNVNADEMQLALALSKSEIQCNNVMQMNVDTETEQQSVEQIRKKLQQYGFNTAGKEDYNYFVKASLLTTAGVKRQQKVRSKWANKFTALTLRNADLQLQKLESKLLAFQQQQQTPLAVTTALAVEQKQQQQQLQLHSSLLRQHSKTALSTFIFDTTLECSNLSNFYIQELFEMCTTKPDHLLKNWHVIPGRDLSPSRRCHGVSSKNRSKQQQLLQLYAELEAHFGQSTTAMPSEANSLAMQTTAISNQIEQCKFSSIALTAAAVADRTQPKLSESNALRAASPDLFADSDSDIELISETAGSNQLSTALPTALQTQQTETVETSLQSALKLVNSLLPNTSVVDISSGSVTSTAKSADRHSCLSNGNEQQLLDDSSSVIATYTIESSEEDMPNLDVGNANMNEEVEPIVNANETSKELETPSESIDLTQESSEDDDEDETETDMCLLLSDDEVNYSIWKANKTAKLNDSMIRNSDVANSRAADLDETNKPFSFLEFISTNTAVGGKTALNRTATGNFDFDDDVELIASQYLNKIGLVNASSSLTDDCSLLPRSEFGIIDSNSQQNFSSTELLPRTTNNCAISADVSLLQSPSESAMPLLHSHYKRNGSASKFQALLQAVQNEEDSQSNSNSNSIELDYDNMDEFDKLIYGSPPKKKANITATTPVGLQQLLTAQISFTNSPQKPTFQSEQEQLVQYKDRTYSIRNVDAQKPKFMQLSEAELLKQLYNYGIKPLKRKQAIQILEYIYNQTHPLLMAADSFDKLSPSEPPAATVSSQTSQYQLQDVTIYSMLRFADELSPELPQEQYVLQTNVTKKTQQPLLPLHIAWYNLLCANPTLHETILLYEPVNLQEIYLFFKGLGYRYDPNDIKHFFDRRCIIFRYDLLEQGKAKADRNRHVRKPKCSLKKGNSRKNL